MAFCEATVEGEEEEGESGVEMLVEMMVGEAEPEERFDCGVVFVCQKPSFFPSVVVVIMAC
jgi:hypothetical protein